MSRFIDKLNRLFRAEPQPMGFRAAKTDLPRTKIQLVASLAQENAESLAGYLGGADAVLLRISKPGQGTKALQKLSQAATDIPCGLWLEGGLGRTKRMAKAGCDFIVFPAAATPLAAFENDETGRILEVEASLSEGLLRAANELPVDAVLVTGEEQGSFLLTWQHLLLFRRFADLLSKPLLVTVPAEVTADELQALWDAGVSGVLTKVEAGQSQDRIKKLRQVIDKLAFPSPHKREKAEAILPRIGLETGVTLAEEEEEEEDDE